jgi:hypothetical protein
MAADTEPTSETSLRTVTVHVNERPVRVPHRVTGLGIKQGAIDQGIPIQRDFVLSEDLGERRTKIIGDADVLSVTERSRFVAVAPDDNS